MREKIKQIREQLDRLLDKPDLAREDVEEAVRLIEQLDREGWVCND